MEKNKLFSSLNRRKYPFLLLVIFCVIYPFIFDPKLFLGGDNAQYYILGKALFKGLGYTDISSPFLSAGHFPPGYPAIIALILNFSNSFIAIKFANGAFFLLSLLLLFRVFKNISNSEHIAFIGCLAIVLNPHILGYSFIMMSEIPFLFFSLLSIYLMIKSENEPIKISRIILIVILLAGAFYIRTQGIALISGLLLYLMLKKSWKRLSLIGIGTAILMLPWIIWRYILHTSSYISGFLMVNPYNPQFGTVTFYDLINRFLANLHRYILTEIPTALYFHPTAHLEFVRYLCGILTIIIIVTGLYKAINYQRLFASYLFFDFLIVLLWPEVFHGIRFIIPIIPFLIFYLIYGIYEIGVYILSLVQVRKEYIILLSLTLLIYFPGIQGMHIESNLSYPKQWKSYFKMAHWISNNTPKKTVVSCWKTGLFYLYAARPTTRFKKKINGNDFINALKKSGVDYVVTEHLGYSTTLKYLIPAIDKYPEAFKLVKGDPSTNTNLYRFTPTKIK